MRPETNLSLGRIILKWNLNEKGSKAGFYGKKKISSGIKSEKIPLPV
jgi:hypothetical protein